jgi:hypothetical protein
MIKSFIFFLCLVLGLALVGVVLTDAYASIADTPPRIAV